MMRCPSGRRTAIGFCWARACIPPTERPSVPWANIIPKDMYSLPMASGFTDYGHPAAKRCLRSTSPRAPRKVIGAVGKEYQPRSNSNPAMRLTLAPDGKSIAYGVGKFKSNLWMLEGFSVKRGWLARLGF